MTELTSNPNREKLREVEVMGRTVYVSQSSEEAYVEFQDELVSMTNLRAWNILMETAKQQAIDGYEKEETLAQKELRRERNWVSEKLRDMAREMDREARNIKATEGTSDE